MTILNFDELNSLRERLTYSEFFNKDGKRQYLVQEEFVEDEILDYLMYAYLSGVGNANENCGTKIKADQAEMKEAIYREIAGKTFSERIKEYVENGGTVNDIIRVAETEAHRLINEGAYTTAVKAGAKNKTWQTMLDNKVRDAHEELEGQTVPIDTEFRTWDDFGTQYPGGFGVPKLDVNCRCYVTFSM